MVERRRQDSNAAAGPQLVAGLEIVERSAGMHSLERHREVGLVHQVGEHVPEPRLAAQQMADPNPDAVAVAIGRPEER